MEKDKTIIEKVKELVFGEETVDETFLDVKTSDGVVLRVSELSEGVEVTIISEDGENISGAAEYTLEDGTVVATDDNGVIVSVTAPAEEEVVEEEEMEEEVVVEENPLDARIAKLEDAIEDVLSKFSEMSTKVEEFSALPADEEIVVGKKDFKKQSKDDALTALSKFRKNKK